VATLQDLVLARLAPYLEGSGPNEDGEWALHCPFHEDHNRSASLNVFEGVWHCNGCGEGGTLDREFLKRVPPQPFYEINSYQYSSGSGSGARPDLSEGMVAGCHQALMDDEVKLNKLISRRGLTVETVQTFEIGWSKSSQAYTIPVRNAASDLINVRFYQLDPKDGRRKIWGVAGHNEPALYPISVLNENPAMVMICEGEWDALLSIQHGVPAVTRTGTADRWNESWSPLFAKKAVVVCHDMDAKGQHANRKVAASVRRHARAVRVVELPYEITAKHGKDLSDWWMEGHSHQEFMDLVKGGAQVPTPAETNERKPNFISLTVLDTMDAGRTGEPLAVEVTITGKKSPPYLLPAEVEFTCDMGAGAKCAICPMQGWNGLHKHVVPPSDPVILEMLHVPKDAVAKTLRENLGIQKCGRYNMDIQEHRTVEEVYARPSLDEVTDDTVGDFTNRKIISVGTHNLETNTTVRFVGTVLPNPKTQQNEFQAWEHEKAGTALDTYEVSDESRERLKVFQPTGRQSALVKVSEISKQLAEHVTRIHQRPEMHMLMDLVFHSTLSFHMGDEYVGRGWLEALIVGDTRTGKSEAARLMIRHYGLGQMLTCEAVSFAGVVGGLEQIQSKEWIVKWGAIPVNDRRLVVMDEVSGLTTDQIGQMSSLRSSGVAELTKIQNEKALARTRLIWMGNPRDRAMSGFTYGVQAINPLIGKNEDIARFDLAMSVATEDVKSSDINRLRKPNGELVYTSELCHELLLWAWSRRTEHITWAPGALEKVFACANRMADVYVDNPPLVQGANVRVKLARLAVAFAMRTYSSPDGQLVLVTAAHVTDAMNFMNRLYGMLGFGYKALSDQRRKDEQMALSGFGESMDFITSNPNLMRFLVDYGGRFKRADMEEMMSISREEANVVISKLWDARVLNRDRGFLKLEAVAMKRLREEVSK
jgi:hypothetical protein